MLNHLKNAPNIRTFDEFFSAGYDLSNKSVHNLDFRKTDINWTSLKLEQTIFLGCIFRPNDGQVIRAQGGIVFPSFDDRPYQPYRSELYQWEELHTMVSHTETVDLKIYEHFNQHRHQISVLEALLQRIHDHSIDDGLRSILKPQADGTFQKRCIGIMGGHSTLRSDRYYRQVALIAQRLTQLGYFIASGGGPGIMEAANLGAYLAPYDNKAVDDAISILSKAPKYTDENYHDTALQVLSKYPSDSESLAIPTWFYGHEPSNVFGSHIAKYFSNSIREDTLLAICIHGILFAPGSAGTTQEIFMDAAQNHYGTFDFISPMVFLGKKRYEQDTNLFPTLYALAENKAYQALLRLVDDVEEAVNAFKNLKPIHYSDLP